jgi:hypothetical protein
MSRQFAAIGFDIEDQAAFRAALGRIGQDAALVARTDRDIHLQWLDPSGASVAFHIDARSRDLVCVTPFFAPAEPTVWRVRSRAPLDDATCRHCGGAVCEVIADDERVLASAGIQWACFRPYRDWLAAPRDYRIAVVGLAHRVAIGPAAPASFAAGVGAGPGGALGPAVTAHVTGRIRAAARLDRSGGGWFWRIRVETAAGALDVVAAGDDVLGEPGAGEHAEVEAWLVGSPMDPPPEPRRSLWRRLRDMGG